MDPGTVINALGAATAPRPTSTSLALTVRELQVLKELAKGGTNQEIAASLQMSPLTVRNHLSSIFIKLKVQSRMQALLIAMRHRLVEPHSGNPSS